MFNDRVYKKTISLDDTIATENEDKENLFKQKGCQCEKKLVQIKKECLSQIRDLKAQQQQEIQNMQKQYEQKIKMLIDKHEQDIRSLNEEIDTFQVIDDKSDKELQNYFEQEQTNDRNMYKQQLEQYIQDKLQLEHQLQIQNQEIQHLRSQLPLQTLQTLQASVHKNCAQVLYRDTNRKGKVQIEVDRSVLQDESGQKFCNSIKNFNANVRLMEKSIKLSQI
ncbi:hypothetical protein pb186bvf_006507 [Paramecium bursaria]